MGGYSYQRQAVEEEGGGRLDAQSSDKTSPQLELEPLSGKAAELLLFKCNILTISHGNVHTHLHIYKTK